MGKQKSFTKAVRFMSDVTSVLLNPISDETLKAKDSRDHSTETVDESKASQSQVTLKVEEGAPQLIDEPDTSSFAAFIYSLLSSSESSNDDPAIGVEPPETSAKGTPSKKGLYSRGKQTLKAVYNAARTSGSRKDEPDQKPLKNSGALDGLEMNHIRVENPSACSSNQLGPSDPSVLLSETTKLAIHSSLPVLIQGRSWVLLYSTWKHGISLSTLYRKSMIWPGLSLLVVGDRKGAVFGGLVEAPLKPSQKRKYQGTNSTFVFTNISGSPAIFNPTGANPYYTLCSPDYLAIGGGNHFALYLDGDLLSGSSSMSETYGNPCLASCEDFEVKEVELWGFVYGSKYDEIVTASRAEAPGICRW